MRLLADENIPVASIRALREAGHDVVSIAEEAKGAADQTLLVRAAAESRLVLTFDLDFGALLYRSRLPSPAGVILLRFTPARPEEPADILLSLAARGDIDLQGWHTVIDRDRIRQRPLP